MLFLCVLRLKCQNCSTGNNIKTKVKLGQIKMYHFVVSISMFKAVAKTCII